MLKIYRDMDIFAIGQLCVFCSEDAVIAVGEDEDDSFINLPLCKKHAAQLADTTKHFNLSSI